jgi:signal transduction histidine kinase
MGTHWRDPRLLRDAPAVLLCVLVLLETIATDQDVPLGLSVPVALAMTVPLIWRRSAPLAVVGVVLGAWAGQGLAGDWELEPQSELIAAAFAFWSLGAYVRERTALVAVVGALAAVLVHEPGDVIVLWPLMLGVFFAGRLMRSRDQLARALERDRVDAERMAVAEERARIARELHDVVAHSISLMTIQAGAERLALGARAPQTAEVLAQIEQTGRQALAEMRRMLGMLRDPAEDPELSPMPGLTQVDSLLERMARAGLQVELTVDGTPGKLPPGLDISGFRIVQEALTNVLKHAEASTASVRITHGAEHVEIEVLDDGCGRVAGSRGAGQGITGMHERVALYQGVLEVGAVSPHGWRVFARLPQESAT